jgi:hypothetical protein
MSVLGPRFSCDDASRREVSDGRVERPEAVPHRRPRRLRANACVREYELFQRSNPMPPATPANAATPGATTATTPLVVLATAPTPLPPLTTTPLALLAAARTRRFRLVIGPPDFLRDPPGLLFFVARPALEAFTPLLRAEMLRERPVVEPTLRLLPRVPFFPLRFTFVCAICPPPK